MGPSTLTNLDEATLVGQVASLIEAGLVTGLGLAPAVRCRVEP